MSWEQDVADVYRHTFAARLDAFADWDETHGHWVAVRSEMTVDRVLAGLTGPAPISTYMEDVAGGTHLGAVDFDRDDGWNLGARVARAARDRGLAPFLERSRRGAHLWLVLDRSVSGTSVRLALREIVRSVEPGAASDPKVEILPKKLVSRGPDSLGSPLRMAMMPHPKTGQRSRLYDADGEPVGLTVRETIRGIRTSPAETILDIADSVRLPASEVVPPDYLRPPRRPGGDVVTVLAAAGLDARPGRTVRCPLHDDRQASLAVARDGERVWCKSPACPACRDGRGLGADQLASALAAR